MSIQHHQTTESHRSSLSLRLAVVAAMVAALVVAVPHATAQSDSEIPDGAGTYFRNCDELDAHLTEVATDALVHRILFGVGRRPSRRIIEAMDIGGGGGGQALSVVDRAFAVRDFTTTNVQEDGVDEPDVIETDGDHIYALQDGSLHIVDAWPVDEVSEVATVELKGWGESIFLAGDTVVAFTTIYEGGYGYYGSEYGDTSQSGRRPRSAPTRVAVIGVTPPSEPEVVHTIEFGGVLVDARAVGGIVYFVIASDGRRQIDELVDEVSDLGLPEIPDDPTDEELARLRREITVLVTPIIADWVATKGRAALIPDVRIDGGERSEMFGCTEIARPATSSDFSMLTIASLDVHDGSLDSTGLMADGWTVYASHDAAYVAQNSAWWWWESPETKYTETNIHQFRFNDGNPVYTASGTVPGWVLNQFSMSEYNGHLRVASTSNTLDSWFEPSIDEGSNAFVLAQNGQLLEIVGEVTGIAPGDDVKSILWLGERGYLATSGRSRRDPGGRLVVLDLSPLNPRLMGELHLTGFSTYLHPFGDDYLIGFGRERDERGKVLGLQLQLFDVVDPANPTRIHQSLLSMDDAGWSSSEAKHDHHAFTFYASRNLLAIPVTLEDWSYDSDEYKYFSGIVVYEVSADNGFTEVGKVGEPRPRRKPRLDRRSLFISEEVDYLYALTDDGLTVSSLEVLDEPVATIDFDDPRRRRRP